MTRCVGGHSAPSRWRCGVTSSSGTQPIPSCRPGREEGWSEHSRAGPFGADVVVSRATLDRWVKAWRTGGFDALLPPRRQVTPRTAAEVLDLAAALKRERPERTGAQVARILRAQSGWSPSERTLLRHFARLELSTRPDGQPPQAFGRFEAPHPNDRWVGDALCRLRHKASYGDRRVMPTGAAESLVRSGSVRIGVGIVKGCRGTP
jgi:transposase